ncbi:MAG: undecaprenyl-diphosphate phosphatase [Aliihoeflea sp.]
MLWTYLLILSVVQGVTEFLPISSSAHLILVRDLFAALGLPMWEGSQADELALDVALHVGSLGAILLYFWRDVVQLLIGLADAIRLRGTAASRMLFLLIVATLPILVVGFLMKDVITFMLRSAEIIAWTTLIFGLLLYVADRQPEREHDIGHMNFRQAIVLGLAQCLALIPGVSRSGIAMTAGRLVGLNRPLSARFALLLSLPTIAGAGLLATVDLYRAGDARLTGEALLGGFFAFVAAWIAVALLMKWLRHFSYTPFVVYRVALGLLLLVLIYGFGWAPGV